MADELQAVRSRLGSYFDTNTNIANQCVINALCITLSGLRMGEAITSIDVVAHGDRFTVTNDGPGLLLEPRNGVPSATELMTELKACHRHPGHIGFETRICRNGLAVVNAVSKSARVVTGQGKAMVQKFSVGRPVSAFAAVDAEMTGTRIDFELDRRWIGTPQFDLPQIELAVASIGVDLSGVSFTVKDS